ncbi:DinB family protein [Mucilaginibacter sp. BJC16-A38]|uniref:DinB family protein n=1 Tax=Mucilaginibacter phenanthrenivorans TaxID=1234842 RepID=UPI0021574662|nr:DinB family protein [Mucilaginibacter phenanthrenivorans]MCR8556889.1 DinB family protein [Mucilaginibacter phenanthrenivorans]
MNPLTEAWQIHNRINLYLLEHIDEANLNDISASKGRTVGEQFAHMHNVRLMWLKAADPLLLESLVKIEKENINKDGLATGLNASGDAIAQLFEKTYTDGKVKGFKPNATGFLGYLVSHESHHRDRLCFH